jgi:glycogen debranching enzyme
MSVVIHRGSSFLVAGATGDIKPATELGFFVQDTRFLSRWELALDAHELLALGVATPRPNEARHFLTNPELRRAARATLAVRLRTVVAGGLHCDVDVDNFGDEEAEATLQLGLGADFEYVLTVKKQATSGTSPHRPRSTAESGADGRSLKLWLEHGEVPREATITFGEKPGFLDASSARWALRLPKRGRFHVCVDVAIRLGDLHVSPQETCDGAQREQETSERARRHRKQVRNEAPVLETDHDVLRHAYSQAVSDLAELRLKGEGDYAEQGAGAIAAGIPWYMDLFGRDSLIAAIESILQDPQLARGTLLALARLQGKKHDPRTEEAPGKILHEYRAGPVPPVARRQIPGYPYYATIDATPWFLVALSEHARITGDLSLARELWPNVLAALEWISRWGDRDGDGFLEYQREGDAGLRNHCWKDSEDSIRFRDGRLADPPIAVVEAQGYVVDAFGRIAQLARHLGHGDLERELGERAATLRQRIATAYWMDDRGTFALALDARKRQVDSLTSNPAHLLFSGAATAAHAKAVARTLASDELFSGFGIRTMGAREGGYNPMSYHNGSVWPHDNALALAGLVRYGLAEEATTVAGGFVSALAHFDRNEPPELFCGFARDDSAAPVAYLQANKPQAWASGAVLLLVRSIAGLSIDMLERRLAVRPLPISGLRHLSLRGVPLGEHRIDVHVEYDRKPRVRLAGLPPGIAVDNAN